MMSVFQPFILTALGLVGFILAYAFIRFLRYEGNATRLLDLEVRAAENSADFAFAPESFVSMIQKNRLGIKPKYSKVENVLRFDQLDKINYLFDCIQQLEESSPNVGNYTGLMLESRKQKFPTFKILRSSLVRGFSHMRIPPQRLPRWFPRQLAVIANQVDHDEVREFLFQNGVLEMLLLNLSVSRAYFDGHYAVLYMLDLYDADTVSFAQTLAQLNLLATLEGTEIEGGHRTPPADDDEDPDIKLLKSSTN